MPRAMVRGEGVTYSDARDWFAWLDSSIGPFTVGDLADAMMIDDDLAARFIRAGTWTIHGGVQQALLEDTGDIVNGTYRGDEVLYRYRPIEDRVWREHPSQAAEWQKWPCGIDAPPDRGKPVRIRTDRDQRRLMSTPGARSKVLSAERAYDKMLEAQAAAKAKAQAKAAAAKDIGNAKKRAQQSHSNNVEVKR